MARIPNCETAAGRAVVKIGDRYICLKNKREVVVIGCNERVVEYKFTAPGKSQGKGIRAPRLNVMTAERELFEERFKAI
jgi:hypothetical protein